jgi:hypothetical protein
MRTELQRNPMGAARYPDTHANTLSAAYAARRSPVPQSIARSAPAGRPAAEPPTDADVLLIALRRSLESCKDTSQLRMLAAFETPRRGTL